MKQNGLWEFFVDTGGTFTDCLARSPSSLWFREKVLSRGSFSAKVKEILGAYRLSICTANDWPCGFIEGMAVRFANFPKFETKILNWDGKERVLTLSDELPRSLERGTAFEVESGWEAPILAMRLILARQGVRFEEIRVQMRLATTRCTNALLERKGEVPVLFLTAGFPDLLEIGDQRRLSLFDLIPQKRKALSQEVVEVKERIDRAGNILVQPDLKSLRADAIEKFNLGFRSAAVSFLHSYLNPLHERKVSEVLREVGFERVVESSSIHPFIKWQDRCESAVVESYLSLILEEYLDRVEEGLGQNSDLFICSSAGGLIDRNQYQAIDSLLSGPAGGVVGAAKIASRCGFLNSINLDMGGTSTDVSRFSGDYSYQSSHMVGGAKVYNLALNLETVAAGGGSVCSVERGMLRVGPNSSGAYPGPACYGFGGPLCLTDVNLLLGRLDSTRFATPIHPEHASIRLKEMVKESGRTPEELLSGFIAVADDAMANAVRKISIEEGYDARDHALLAFGGAGGQHACGVARRLGIETVLSPADSGLLSAYGLSKSRVERLISKSYLGPIDAKKITSLQSEMIESGKKSIAKTGERGEVLLESIACVRFVGQDSYLEIPFSDPKQLEPCFRNKFTEIFGYYPEGKELEIHSLRVRVAGSMSIEEIETFTKKRSFKKREKEVSIYYRDQLKPGDSISGPCLLVDDFGTLWIDEEWEGVLGDRLTIRLEMKHRADSSPFLIPEVAKRELFSSKFLCLTEEMGSRLERTALSVNIRERLDFSCALLDAKGFLVANAPHIPVHLGAMGLFTRSMIDTLPDLVPGDVLVSNHPAYGGSHLPDVSVLAPVFDGSSPHPICFLANRAHHAEIGGISPGSMPALAKSLAEEGVLLCPQYLFKAGVSRMNQIAELLKKASYPSRQVEQNIADLSAQVASLRQGVEVMHSLISAYGQFEIKDQMEKLREESRESCIEFLETFGKQELWGEQTLDGGDKLSLKVSIDRARAVFDFSGTSSARDNNLNAPKAIVHSVICYCLRTLIGSELPLNEGLLDPVEIILPLGSILNPIFSEDLHASPAVAGGNVEISQRLTDLILSSAFKKVACSQGTMNNLTFGNDGFSHYETLCGGAGAMVGCTGTSAVQVHMTNTAITDPEILESRFPIRLICNRIRKNSGGNGIWHGGSGLEREYLFEEPTQFSLLTQRRTSGPEGINGAGAGLPGKQILKRADGTIENLGFAVSCLAEVGDKLLIHTPGGGGAS